MKKILWILVAVLCFGGCASVTAPVMETVADEVVQPVAADPKPMAVWLPEDAAAQTAIADAQGERCYTWDDCELRLQTLDGGDIRATLRKLTGLDPEKLTVMEYERDGLQFYQTVWSMTGEEGVMLGRCMVADDGSYHYCISLTSPENVDVGEDYAQICASLDLSGKPDTGK